MNLIQLFDAIKRNDKEIIISNAAVLPTIINLQDPTGFTSLHYLFQQSYINLDIFELLLNNGANYNIVDNFGHIPSYYYSDINGNIKLSLPLVEQLMRNRNIVFNER